MGSVPTRGIGTPTAGKSASLTFRLVLRAFQPITMSKIFLAASAMPCSSSRDTPRIVDCCQCCQSCQFQFPISNIGIDNWQHSHTGNI